MKADPKSKGPWVHRFAIRFFTVVLGVLVFWLLGFLVKDIESVRGPDYSAVEQRYVDKGLVAKQETLKKQIAELTRQIENQNEKQRVIGDGSKNLQQTIAQLVDLQKAGIQKNISFSDAEQANFTSSVNLFLDNQEKYQDLSQATARLVEQKQSLAMEEGQARQEIKMQRRPAKEEYKHLRERHRLKLAVFQLAILGPILGVATFVVIRKRSNIYFPLFLGFAGAAFLKVVLVVHAYFPSKYFKYILIVGLLLVVARVLVFFIRTIAFPKTIWLVKQYREAYERFLCPVCEYPIRTGPRRFLYWTRRTVNKIVVPREQGEQEETYTCPSCGRGLFEECSSCHKVRHVLLPHCAHCGAEKAIE